MEVPVHRSGSCHTTASELHESKLVQQTPEGAVTKQNPDTCYISNNNNAFLSGAQMQLIFF